MILQNVDHKTDDKNAHLFTPAFAFSHQNPSSAPSYSSLTSSDLDALLQEMGPDIRAADRDLRDIDNLEKKGVTGAGRLEEYEPLLPRLATLLKDHKEDTLKYQALESRLSDVLERYTTHVDALSELFVEWNDVLDYTEDQIIKLERAKADRADMGLP